MFIQEWQLAKKKNKHPNPRRPAVADAQHGGDVVGAYGLTSQCQTVDCVDAWSDSWQTGSQSGCVELC